AGRVRVRVSGEGFLDSARDVAAGQESFSMPFKMAHRAAAQPVGRAGGSLSFGQAQVQVPAGAFSDGATVSLTYLARSWVASVMASPQFVDDDDVPRRVVAGAALESSDPAAAPVRVRIPVPADAPADAV